MSQQTAVSWLLSELQIRLSKIKSEPDGIVRETMINNFLIDVEQAKQMECVCSVILEPLTFI